MSMLEMKRHAYVCCEHVLRFEYWTFDPRLIQVRAVRIEATF